MFDSDLECVSFDTNVVRLDGLKGGQLHGIARSNVESGAVARTFDLLTLELALIERAAIVRAQVVDCIELAIDVADSHIVVANAKDRNAFGRNIRRRANRLPGRHARSPRMVAQTRSSSDGSCSRARVDWKKPSTMSCSAVERSRP